MPPRRLRDKDEFIDGILDNPKTVDRNDEAVPVFLLRIQIAQGVR